MLRAIADYLRKEVWPRRRELVRGSQLWMAVIVGLGFALFAADWGVADTEIGGVLAVILAYAGVAFGFCLTGLTVALTLPNREFVEDLATRKPGAEQVRKKGRVANAYSDLLFVFSWTAVAHWLVIATGLVMLAGCGVEAEMISDPYRFWERVKVGLFAALVLYAVTQFLVTMITLSQVGNRYIDFTRQRAEK